MTLPAVEHLRELLHYDPESGVFTRKVRTARKHQIGDRADFPTRRPTNLYRYVCFGKKMILAHRLAWFYVYGRWPAKHIDHVNGLGWDNRIENLREADDALNKENIRKPQANNKSGFLGVVWHPKNRAWIARLQHKGVSIYIGTYLDPAEAHAAYLERKRELHKGCTI